VFKKYLKVTVELDDIDDDELDDYDECDCCCDDEDDDECCCDEECCCECGDEPKAETAEEYEDVESEDTDAE
ncbi:MAG: hypothetical protein LUH54_00090, partial [Firmicutes bacterium]|nr:hypothetical protein [Bacillota bacterium]